MGMGRGAIRRLLQRKETLKRITNHYMEEIRLLSKDDIEVRVAQTLAGNNKVRVNLLLYKNARVDMKIMDELFTPMGWKRTHKLIGDRLYCCVEVYNPETKEWICKEDVGVESNTEAEKGQASDSFKRACVNWGIGRELYTAPKITIELNENEYTKDQNSRIKVWATFSVKTIDYDKKTRTITSLEIVDRNGNVRFSMNAPVEQPKETPKAEEQPKTSKRKNPYKPVADEIYWRLVQAHAQKQLCPSGMTAKDKFIELTNAGKAEQKRFDEDVANFLAAN